MAPATLLTIFNFLVRVGMAVSPLSYAHQIYLMHTLQSTEAFDNYTSFTLLNSSIARVFFWLSKRFDVALLAQSAMCILCQHLILWYCAKYPKQRSIGVGLGLCRRVFGSSDSADSDPDLDLDLELGGENPRNPTENGGGEGGILEHGSIRDGVLSWFRSFFDWRDYLSYLVYTISLSLVLGFCTVFLVNQPIYFEALGMVSLLWDACIALPQLIRTCSLQDVRGLSAIMVSFWLIGDFLKFIYFGYFGAPIQFFIGDGVQTIIEGSLCVTYFIFARRRGDINEISSGDKKVLMESCSSSSSTTFEKEQEIPTISDSLSDGG